MMTNLRKLSLVASAIVLTVSVFASSASGQTSSPPSRTVSLDEAVNYALQNYPAVRASLEQVNCGAGGCPLARSQYLPVLDGAYQMSRATQNQVPGIWLPTSMTPTVEGPIGASSGQSFWGSQAIAFFSWEPFDFGLRPSAVGLAKTAQDKANADLAVTRLQVATAVGNYFLIALAAQQARDGSAGKRGPLAGLRSIDSHASGQYFATRGRCFSRRCATCAGEDPATTRRSKRNRRAWRHSRRSWERPE